MMEISHKISMNIIKVKPQLFESSQAISSAVE